MDLSSAQRLNLLIIIIIILLLTSPNIVHPDGVKHGLRCVNDFLSIINCSMLYLTSSGNTSDTDSPYWLTITDEIDEFKCILSKANEGFFCSVDTMPNQHPDIPFMDTDEYEISLCGEYKACKPLEASYTPVKNIKPNPPCFLALYHNLTQHHFTWKSTYEEYSTHTSLVDNLMYQLRYYKTGDQHNVTTHDINTESTDFSMDDDKLLPDTEYAAKLRASPNQVFYRGQWSDWSSEVRWRTEPASEGGAVRGDDQKNAFTLELVLIFVPFCVILPVVLALCFAPLKKWRYKDFIPTPAPYFQSLYSDCHGDFKSWVVMQENPTDMLKTEETLQIDTLTKCAEEECCPPQPQHHYICEGSTYSNLTEMVTCDAILPGVPYAVSSLQSTSLSSGSSYPTEGDSGCWLCSDQSLEKSPSWYCNEYCTLSSFQQCGLVPAQNHRGPAEKLPPPMTGEIIKETPGNC